MVVFFLTEDNEGQDVNVYFRKYPLTRLISILYPLEKVIVVT